MKRTSITLVDSVYEVGQKIASKRGFSQSFSGYVAWLVSRDAEGSVTREEAPMRKSSKIPVKAAPTSRRSRRGGRKLRK
jgi:hypothetical protein